MAKKLSHIPLYNAEMDEIYDACFSTDIVHSWYRQDDERDLWYIRFRLYLRMGDNRTLLGTINESRRLNDKEHSNSVPGAWWRAHVRHEWKKRAQEFDLMYSAMIDKIWLRKRTAFRIDEIGIGESLLSKAERMLQYPLEETKVVQSRYEDGREKTVTVISPNKWSIRDVPAIVNAGDKLMRLAMNMTTENTAQVIADFTDSKDIEKLSDEVLDEIITRYQDTTSHQLDNEAESVEATNDGSTD